MDGVQTGRHSPATTQPDRQTDRQTGRQTGRQAGRQADRQTGWQWGRQADALAYRHEGNAPATSRGLPVLDFIYRQALGGQALALSTAWTGPVPF